LRVSPAARVKLRSGSDLSLILGSTQASVRSRARSHPYLCTRHALVLHLL